MSKIIQAKIRDFKRQIDFPATSRYNVRFSDQRAKETQRNPSRILDPITKQHSLALRKNHSKDIEQTFNQTSVHPFIHPRSSSFETQRKFYDNNEMINQQNYQENFFKSQFGFPMRKKRSGEQQLIKLLLKHSDNQAQNTRYQEELQKMKNPLFDQQVKKDTKIIPKLKNRIRFNWNKYHDKMRSKQISQQESYKEYCVIDYVPTFPIKKSMNN